jgi:HSP20 family protein
MAQQVSRREERMPVRRGQAVSPWGGMRETMERWMDEFFQDWPLMRIRPFEWRMQEFTPSVDVIDEEKEIRVEAEVPGMTAQDIDVTLTGGNCVVISGEKKSGREEEKEGVRYSERSYGSFRRSIPLPEDVETEKAEATFRNGVLCITLPKSPKAIEQTKKIEIRSEP